MTKPRRSTPLASRHALRCALLLLVALPVGPGLAADAPASPENKLEIGVEERIRCENWDNLADFDQDVVDARHQVRFRTRIWEKLNLGSRVELMFGLANETFRKTTPATRFVWDETVVENLYVDYRFCDRLSARLGRQNLSHAEGFLLADGTPLDGSRTAYFNALDVTWTRGKSKLELLAISDRDRDQYIPPINNKAKSLIEWDEAALGLYFTGNDIPKTGLEAYYFYKTETGDHRPASNLAAQRSRCLHTLGGRLARQFGSGWSLTAEVAGQAGQQEPDTDILAWAGYASAKKAFACRMKPSLSLGYIGLSGDDAATAKLEGWNPLFSRWPKWSEMFLYSLATEKGPAYWTNFSMWQAEFLIAPLEPLNLRATYYRLGAFHPYPGSAAIFAGGKTRGDLYELRADYKFNDGLRAHLVGEWLEPGHFYVGCDPAWFFRAEVSYSLRRTLGL